MIDNIKFNKNLVGRDFVVGDVHGCWQQLQDELGRVDFDYKADRLFSVGDLIDRGPESLSCLKLIEETWFYPVLGNHESFMIASLMEGRSSDCWYANGGAWVEGFDKNLLYRLTCGLVYTVPLTITLETELGLVGISHAQPPTTDWSDVYAHIDPRAEMTSLWERSLINCTNPPKTANVDMTIHGHTPVKKVTLKGNALFIDTGSFIKERGHIDYMGVKVHKISDLMEEHLHAE